MINNDYKFQYPEYQEELDEHRQQHMWEQEKMNDEETVHYITGAVAAGLVIAGVFIVIFFLFLLFCTKVWLA